MARTKKQIEQSFATAIEDINPSVDTVKGPIPDIFITPQALQIRETEQRIDDLSRRYSLDYTMTQNTQALALYGINHGLRKSPGKSASGYAYFFTFTRLRSGNNISIPAGTIVSTADSRIAYQTTKSAVIIGSSIDSYYNATKRRYEVRAPVASLGIGSEFDIPAGRLRSLQSNILGLDGVENRAPIRGSVSEQSNEAFGSLIRSKFNGTALGSGDGLRQIIQNFDSARITDVSIVFSSDYKLFKRRTRRAAWDIYLIGEDEESSSDTFTGDGFTNSFVLSKQPVFSVSSVLVNGSAVAYSFEKDTSYQTGESYIAKDKVVLPFALAASSTLTVEYNYDVLIRDTQEYLSKVQVDLYEADSLVRRARQVPLKISISIQVLSTFDEAQAISDALAIIQDFGNPGSYTDILYPEALRGRLASEIGGVSKVQVTGFSKRDTGSLPIDALEFETNEYPVISDADITIVPRR